MIPIPKEENLKQFHTSRFLSLMEVRTALQLWSLSEIAWTPFFDCVGSSVRQRWSQGRCSHREQGLKQTCTALVKAKGIASHLEDAQQDSLSKETLVCTKKKKMFSGNVFASRSSAQAESGLVVTRNTCEGKKLGCNYSKAGELALPSNEAELIQQAAEIKGYAAHSPEHLCSCL